LGNQAAARPPLCGDASRDGKAETMIMLQRAPYEYRDDLAVSRFADDRPIIVFDGECVLCSTFARFILRTDRVERFRLLAAQSALGTELYRHFGLRTDSYETYLLLEDGSAFLKSDATIRIFAGLGFPWRLATVARIVPRPLRDALYDFVARNRYRWFGQRTCVVNDASWRGRLLS
jgi:predicted DCC family thiol-disulfide oxidoreductase YuxK